VSEEPFIAPVDLKAAYLARQPEIDAAIRRVLDSGWYIGGAEVADFEHEFAAYFGVRHAVGTGSGTDALHLALRACGIGPGDAVLTVSHTAVATVAAIELAGAQPRFVDIDPATFTMDPEALVRAVAAVRAERGGPILKAVIPVHLYGHPADMARLTAVARATGLTVIEDCAQAHGARIADRPIGTYGDMAAFSFYPTKNLGALGDGGAVITNNDGLADAARLVREYGWRERYVSDVPGMNTRLDPLQAAVLRVRLPYLDAENAARREIAGVYDRALAGTDLVPPTARPGTEHVYHQYVLRANARDALRAGLKRVGIGSLIHYPLPVHLQPAYAGRIPVPAGGLPQTEAVCRDILSLPIYPQMPAAYRDRVAAAVRTAAAG